jgi:hypothetical protein
MTPYARKRHQASHTAAIRGATAARTAALLAHAYRVRPCLICAKPMACRHREPAIELAIAAWRGIGAPIERE